MSLRHWVMACGRFLIGSLAAKVAAHGCRKPRSWAARLRRAARRWDRSHCHLDMTTASISALRLKSGSEKGHGSHRLHLRHPLDPGQGLDDRSRLDQLGGQRHASETQLVPPDEDADCRPRGGAFPAIRSCCVRALVPACSARKADSIQLLFGCQPGHDRRAEASRASPRFPAFVLIE